MMAMLQVRLRCVSPAPESTMQATAPTRLIVRETCNRCSEQKIRCSKDRPTCKRCQKKGLVCIYDYSRRCGRRSWRPRPSEAEAFSNWDDHWLLPSTAPAISNHDQAAMTSTDNGVSTQALAGPGTTNARSEPTDVVYEADDSILGLSAWPLMCQSATTNFNAVAGNLDCSALREPWGSIDGSAQVVTPPVSRDKMALRGDDYSISKMSSHAPISASLNGQLSQEQEQPLWATALGDRQMSWTLPTPASEGFESENCCLFRAMELVSSLHASRYVCKRASRTSRLESENGRCIDVDEALFQNRDGLATIDRILNCDKCTEERLPLVMCCLAIEEILGWYEAVAGLTSAMDPEHPPSQDSHDNLTSRVFTRPLVMGEYHLKPSLQLAIRAKAVSSEVQERLIPLLQAIQEKHCGSSPEELGIVKPIEEHCQEMSWWCQQIIARAEAVAWA